MSKVQYLTQLRGRRGWYFQRAVPRPLQRAIRLKLWRWKAGDTLEEARRELPGLLEITERRIQEVTDWNAHNRRIREEARAWVRGKTKAEIDEAYQYCVIPMDPVELQELQRLPPVRLITADELIERAVSLKKPAGTTLIQWKTRLREFLDHAELVNPSLATKDQARSFRDSMVDSGRLKVSTIKTRINYLSGLWNFMVDEEVVAENIWSGVTKRLKSEPTVRVPIDIAPVDQAARSKLTGDHLRLFLLLRYSGMRAAEAAGLRFEDIDTEERVIELVEHESRPLKTSYSRRVIPLHPELCKLEWRGCGLMFPQFYEVETLRWGNNLHWTQEIGVSPGKFRHYAKQAMREAEIDSAVSRAVLGHKPENVGESYGGITITQKRRAVEVL